MPLCFKFRHFDRHESSLYKMKRTDWLLCLAKNCDWFKFKYTEKMPFYFKFRHFDKHENSTDVILCL